MRAKKTISIKKQVVGAVLGACVPVFVLLFAINTYAIHLIQQRIFESTYDAMSLNMIQLDNGMQRVSDYLMTASEERKYVSELISDNRDEKSHGESCYAIEIRERVVLYNMIEGIMVYSPVNQNRIYSFNSQSSEFSERESIMNHVVEKAGELTHRNGMWQICEVEGKKILICVSGNEDILFASWTTFDTLMEPVKNWKLANNSVLCFVSGEGERYTEVRPELEELDYAGDISQYYYSGKRDQYLMFGVSSAVGDFRLVNVVKRKDLLNTFYKIREISILLLMMFFLILIPWMLKKLTDGLFRPITDMEKGIARVEKGDVETRIEKRKSSQEMEHLIDSFNNMTGQIRDLKIQTYEDEIERQKMILNYMQLQIKPHFYLNAMNLINTMAQIGDIAMIKELTENLSVYLRYLTSTKAGVTTVKEETAHIENYLKIMEIRYGNRFYYEKSIEENMMNVQIPPLMIQTLIENSMKYAFNFYEDMKLSVKVFQEGKDMVCIVTDNGNGYPEEILTCFQKDEEPAGDHIGLWNNKMRLRYMYPDKTKFLLSNIKPHGAKTEIRIRL